MIEGRFNIGEIAISITNLPKSLQVIEQAKINKNPGYICVTNSRTTYLANHNPEYCLIQNSSLLTVPDGVPLVWIARNMGLKEVSRVSGPDFMDAILKNSAERKYTHYFYGSTPETMNKMQTLLKRKYPNIIIKGAVSPPFQPLEEFDIEYIAKEINKLKPTFFWCGLGAPKQERFIATLQPKLDNTICAGVGLAFEYLAKTVVRAPHWMQILGLEWAFRLSQQPKNIKSAIRPFSWIVLKLILSFFKKV